MTTALAEYGAFRHGTALVDRADLAVLRAHGRDPLKMVQGLLTNDVAGLEEHHWVWGAFLTPRGRMVADARVARTGAALLLVVSRDALEGLTAHLKKYVPPLFARFENTDFRVLGVYGPGGAAHAAHESARSVDTLGLDAGLPVAAGAELVVPSAHVAEVRTRLEAAGARPVGRATLDVVRVEDGRPVWGAELTEAVIPLEAGLRHELISESKGCYTGQEVIIRILHRGHVNRHLRGLHLGGAPVPRKGAALVRADDGKAVGEVTSACASPRFEETIALGYVRREVQPPAELRLETAAGPAVRVVALPFEGGSIPAGSAAGT